MSCVKLGPRASPTSVRRLLARAQLHRAPQRTGRAGASSCRRRRRASSPATSSPSRASSRAATTCSSSSSTAAAAPTTPAAPPTRRRPGHPAGAQPRPLLRRAADPLPAPRPRQHVHRPPRRRPPQRADHDPADPGSTTERHRNRRALRTRRVPRLAADSQPRHLEQDSASTSSTTTPSPRTAPSPCAHRIRPPRPQQRPPADPPSRQTRPPPLRVLPCRPRKRHPSNGTLHASPTRCKRVRHPAGGSMAANACA